VRGQLLIAGVEVRLIPMRFTHRTF
jgi:hypothetical protein